MADFAARHHRNAPGRIYVDTSCIDCMVCKDLAPAHFDLDLATETFFVCKQPSTASEMDCVQEAIDACPCHCIGCDGPVLLSQGEASCASTPPQN
ncbi:ferredoxin [Roseateles sp. BYS180W]|uniref:Ferredoxin n=1 Tax=Roseateles rivi TaxID=3299028 RepID=A0ABW7FTZ0_9BURK